MRPATIRSFAFAATLAVAGVALSGAAARANILISIDKSSQSMSVTVDGAPRYIWPVSTGRSGYDTPNGSFKPNRMDADHLSQEWDNAPMPNTIFFDLRGHAIHGFFDVKHLGLPVSHGCVRLSPDHAQTLFDLVKTEGMANTSVIVGGRTPNGRGPAMVRQPAPADEAAAAGPMSLAPQYGRQPDPNDAPPPGYAQPGYGQPVYVQRSYGQPAYGQSFPPQPQPYYGQPVYRQW
jgi:hypothetical protein